MARGGWVINNDECDDLLCFLATGLVELERSARSGRALFCRAGVRGSVRTGLVKRGRDLRTLCPF